MWKRLSLFSRRHVNVRSLLGTQSSQLAQPGLSSPIIATALRLGRPSTLTGSQGAQIRQDARC